MLLASVPVRAPELVERVRTPTPIWGLGKPSLLALPWEKSAYAAPSELILPGPGFGHAPRDHAQGTPTGPCSPFPQPSLSRQVFTYEAFNEAEGSRSPRTDQSRARSQPSKEKVLTHHTGPVLWHMERWPGHCSRGRRGGAHSQQVGGSVCCAHSRASWPWWHSGNTDGTAGPAARGGRPKARGAWSLPVAGLQSWLGGYGGWASSGPAVASAPRPCTPAAPCWVLHLPSTPGTPDGLPLLL